MNKKHIHLFAAVACALTAACSQIPWDSTGDDSSSPAVQAATEALPLPVPIPATPTASSPAKQAPPVAANLGQAARAKPSAALEAKELEPPRAVDPSRPADDLWDRIRAGFAMADLDSPLVGVRERWYASQPDYLKRMVERSKLYLYYIVEEVERRGMPTEIALLPMVESAFNPMAYSRSHASGLWQFIPSTGKRHQLTQNWWADERRDVVASTNAALDYLPLSDNVTGDDILNRILDRIPIPVVPLHEHADIRSNA